MEVDHAAQAAYIDFGVDSRGVGAAVEISPTINVDLDPSGVAVGVELLSLVPEALALEELCARGRFRAADAALIEANLPVILQFLAAGPDRPATPGVDYFYLVA